MRHLNLQRLTPVVPLLAAGAITNTVNLLGANWALFSPEPFPEADIVSASAASFAHSARIDGGVDGQILSARQELVSKQFVHFAICPRFTSRVQAMGRFLISSHSSHVSAQSRAHRKCLQREACANFEQKQKTANACSAPKLGDCLRLL